MSSLRALPGFRHNGDPGVIDVLGPVVAAAHGGCMECDPNDDRGDDIHVFMLGGRKVCLCRSCLTALRASLERAERRSDNP